jgi:choline dehydrogenase
MDEYDYVIVGSGAAASVLAARLGEDRANKVCVLEAGPPDTNPFIRIPAGFMKTIFDTSVTYQYQTEPGEGTAGRQVNVVQGRTVGGGSSVNGMLYVRGQKQDYEAWAAAGNPGWGYADVLPYFKRTETRHGPGDDRVRGRAGALPVSDYRFDDPLCEAFVKSAEACGVPRTSDYNGPVQFGSGRYQTLIHKRRRVSAAEAFLHPAVRRGNVDLRTHAMANRIRFEGRKATGVDYIDGDGKTRTVSARRGVIVSAGSINSPKLLQLSGIGPGDLLKQHGIPVVYARNSVGDNLRDHYTARHVYRVKDARSLNDVASGAPLLWQIMKYFLGLPSILEIPPGNCFAFAKSRPDLPDADLQLTFAPASMKQGTIGLLDDFPGMTCGIWKHRADSYGSVRITSADVRVQPFINPNYLSDKRDRQGMLAGLRLVRKIFATEPLSQYVVANALPGPGVETDDELLDFARQYGSGTYHLTGSCRMGPASDSSTVVGSDLKVHGVDNLWVADASVMPTEPSGNTYAPTMMIAEKASDMILGKSPLPPVIL